MTNATLHQAPRRIGYARVSTKDQNLAIQRAALKQAECGVIFEDHGISGAKASRPGLDKALDTLSTGDVLIVYRLDRLGRSVQNLSELLAQLDQRGVHFRSVGEGLDTTTPGGRLVFHILSAVAEMQRETIIENAAAGLQAARLRGVKIGRPRAMDDATIREAHRCIVDDGLPCAYVARLIGVHRVTLQRAFRRLGLCFAEKISA